MPEGFDLGFWEAIACITSVCVCMTSIFGAWNVFKKVVLPFKTAAELLATLDKRSQEDYKARLKNEKTMKILIKGMIAVCRSLEASPVCNAHSEIQDFYKDLREHLVEEGLSF